MCVNKESLILNAGEWFLYRYFGAKTFIVKRLALNGIALVAEWIGIPVDSDFKKRMLASRNLEEDKMELSLLLNVSVPESEDVFFADAEPYFPETNRKSSAAEYYTPDILESLREVFKEEVLEYFNELVDLFEKKNWTGEDVYKFYRTAHTLKGSAATVGFDEFASVSYILENFMHEMSDASKIPSLELKILLLTAVVILAASVEKESDELFKIGQILKLAEHFKSSFEVEKSNISEDESEAKEDIDGISDFVSSSVSVSDVLQNSDSETEEEVNEVESENDAIDKDMADLLRDVFNDEAEEHLSRLDLKLEQLVEGKEETLYELFRITHTLKGAAATVGFSETSAAAHKMETFFEELHKAKKFPSGKALELLFYSGTLLRKSVENGVDVSSEIEKTLKQALNLMEQSGESVSSESEFDIEENEISVEESSPQTISSISKFLKIPVDGFDSLVASSEDMVFIRTQFEKSRDEFFSIKSDLQLSHRTLRNFILEDRKNMTEAERQERITEIEVEISEIINNMEHSFITMSKQCKTFREEAQMLQEKLMNFRVTNLHLISLKLKSAVREFSFQTGKRVKYKFKGASIELDKQVVDNLSVPLIQIVRNAIAHGIESPEERLKKGKSSAGTVSITAKRDGSFVNIEIKDDGAGIDMSRVKEVLLDKGFFDKAQDIEKLSDEEILESIFFSGFSTKKEVSNIAGRGVGLDLVRQQIYKLGGEISVETHVNEGTSFLVRVPITTFVSQVLLLRLGGEVYGIPVKYAVEIIEYPNVQRISPGKRILWKKHSIPIVPLHHYFAVDTDSYGGGLNSFIIVISHGDKHFGITADKLIGIKDVTVKNLGVILTGLKFFSGAVVSGAGTVQMILNIPYLALIARSSLELKIRFHGNKKKKVPKILICDDSKSVREAVVRVLSERGYTMVTAQDGWEAWNLLHEEFFDLLITDLEMPRMTGYELIAELQRDSYLKQLPIVVLSSRTGETSLKKVKDAGKARFISKPVKPLLLRRIINEYLPINEELMTDKVILFATSNNDKMREFKDLIKKLPIEVWGVDHFKDLPDVEETGSTFEENAVQKAKARFIRTGVPSLADDSGLEVDALGGAPGVRSARYAGENASDRKRVEFLLENMKGKTDRKARFVSVLAFYYDINEKPVVVRGECEGEITEMPRGEDGFGYDPVFLLPSGKTMAEISLEEKNSISHRAKAFKQLLPYLEKFAYSD